MGGDGLFLESKLVHFFFFFFCCCSIGGGTLPKRPK